MLKRTLLNIDVLYLRFISDYLTFSDFKRLDEAIIDHEEEETTWDELLGNMVGCRCVEGSYLDIPDLDWLMSKKRLRMGKAVVKTARLPGNYPFKAEPAFFDSIKELRLFEEAYLFLTNLSTEDGCEMTLTALEIDGPPLTGVGVEDNLQHLLVNRCTGLKELSLHNMGMGISDDVFIEFSQVLQEDSLTTLSLGFDEKSTDFRHGLQSVTFMCLASKLTVLRVLELTNFYLVTDEALFIISLHCSTLEVVDISFCPEVTGGGVRVLANTSKNLRRLSVRECKLVADDIFFGDGIRNPDGSVIPGSSSSSGWDAASTSASADERRDEGPRTLAALRAAEGNSVWENLSELILEDCSAVTNEALLLLPLLTPNLTKFSLANCNFSDWALEAFFRGLDQQQGERWSTTRCGKVEVGQGSLRNVCLYGCEIREQTLEALLRHHTVYLERVGFTSKIDNETIKKLEAAGVKMDWIPWWTDESW